MSHNNNNIIEKFINPFFCNYYTISIKHFPLNAFGPDFITANLKNLQFDWSMTGKT